MNNIILVFNKYLKLNEKKNFLVLFSIFFYKYLLIKKSCDFFNQTMS